MNHVKKALDKTISILYPILNTQNLPLGDKQFIKVWYKHYLKILQLSYSPSHIKQTIPPRVLEIGLGYGVISLALNFMGYKVIASEHPSRELIKKDFLNIFLKNEIKIVLHDLNDGLPFHNSCFDIIFFCDVIEHLYPWKIHFILNEIKRCLKKDGELILSTPNLCRFSNIPRFISGRRINPSLIPQKFGETFDHIREFSFKEIQYLLQGEGFKIKIIKFGLIPFFDLTQNKKIRKLNYIISKLMFPLFPWYGDEIYIKGSKKCSML